MPIAFDAFEERCQEHRPSVFLVLGSGLGDLVQRIDSIAMVPFASIPGLPASSVSGHRGRWTLGRWGKQMVIASEGRLHFYEGHSWEVVAQPIQTAARLGVRFAILTNAAGGIRDDLQPGSLMPISDHLQWNQPHPWRQPPAPSPYSSRLVDLIRHSGLASPAGVYAAVTGPSYETPAEIRALRSAGADAVGMSTSREVIAGVAAGLECAAVSMITNRAAGLSSAKLDHHEVLATGQAAASRLARLVEAILDGLD